MVLNNTNYMYTIGFPINFFYPEVKAKWEPIIERMRLPYNSVQDFINQQIQSIEFPGVNIETSTQQRGQYEITYPGGKELEVLIDKSLSITFKLTESYISYWIIWDQLDLYLHYSNSVTEHKPCWLPPVELAFLNDAGFQLTKFLFEEITLTSLSSLSLSYAQQAATYNTFSLGMKYNRFNILDK